MNSISTLKLSSIFIVLFSEEKCICNNLFEFLDWKFKLFSALKIANQLLNISNQRSLVSRILYHLQIPSTKISSSNNRTLHLKVPIKGLFASVVLNKFWDLVYFFCTFLQVREWKFAEKNKATANSQLKKSQSLWYLIPGQTKRSLSLSWLLLEVGLFFFFDVKESIFLMKFVEGISHWLYKHF